MPVPETDVLKPVDPSITDSDHWEIFVLSDAQVFYESNGKPASLLAAYADTPLRVQGRLDAPGRGQMKYFLTKPYKPVDIEIRHVTRFSYGEMTDGAYVIWAQGKAGWFEIRPAQRYQAVFDDMARAVELLYFVTDIYNEPRKRGGGPSAQLIFQETVQQKRTSKSSPAAVPASASVVTAAKSRRSQEKTATPKSDEPPKKDENWWEAAALFEFMQKAVNQRVLRAGRNHITLKRVAELVVRRYEIEELETAQNVLLVHARNLCYMMDHPRRKAVSFFANEPIYQELATGHSLSAAEQRRAESVELRPRRDHATLRHGESESSDTSDEEEDDDAITTPVRRPPGRRKKGRLSVLRPKSSKFSGKGKGKGIKGRTGKAGKGKAPVPDSEAPSDDSEAEGSASDSGSADEMGIDTPTQVLSPGREKRKLVETDADREEEKGRRKRAASASIGPTSPPTSTESGDEDEQAASDEPPLPLRHRPSNVPPHSRPLPNTKPATVPSIVSTPLPTYEPNGPRDSWICSFDGCSQRIYGCSKEIGRQLITEHLEDHSKGREKVVGILWREQDKLHLPVRLVEIKMRRLNKC
ncbi:hypothetical protein N0V83_010526 [Neocucurbitaria cava]|uniref:DNA (cytosine-5)-methyltransferase 1 replication foci domain-containing protein n=1 Tax=Neocucurbitaria cava TaxID=798079 RepID=A0A9W8XYN9_9PLEO|nr:hypothetical protein N0V83_010526 [Neocucurbitaria cava]